MAFAAAAAAIYVLCCFAVAALEKARDPGAFAKTIGAIVPALPTPVRAVAAFALIVAEFAVAVTIGFGLIATSSVLVAVGSMAGALLSALFVSVLILVLQRGEVVVCRCFGEEDAIISPRSVLGPIALAAASLFVLAVGLAPLSGAIWFASAMGGVYLLTGHRLLNGLPSLQADLTNT